MQPLCTYGELYPDVLEIVLDHCDAKTVKEVELVCKRFRLIITRLEVWKSKYLAACDVLWKRPSKCFLDAPQDWKYRCLDQLAEIDVKVVHRRVGRSTVSPLSATVLWRVNFEILKAGKVKASHPFKLGMRDKSTPLTWKLNIQKRTQGFTLFLDQYQTSTRIAGSLALLNPETYRVLHSAPFNNVFGMETSFPIALPSNRTITELVVALDIMVFPNDLTDIDYLFDVVVSEKNYPYPAKRTGHYTGVTNYPYLRKHLITAIGELVSIPYCTDAVKCKKLLHANTAGMEALMQIIEDPEEDSETRYITAGSMWNLLDISDIGLPTDMIRRIVRNSVETLSDLFFSPMSHSAALYQLWAVTAATDDEDSEIQMSCAKEWWKDSFVEVTTRGHKDAEKITNLFTKTTAWLDRAEKGDHGVKVDDVWYYHEESFQNLHFTRMQLRESYVSSFIGILWNIPIKDEFRNIMAEDDRLFGILCRILCSPIYRYSHFTCIHLLTALMASHKLPSHYNELVRCSVDDFIRKMEEKEDTGGLLHFRDVGVTLMQRDIADFFLPLLQSKYLPCVAFGRATTPDPADLVSDPHFVLITPNTRNAQSRWGIRS